MSPAARAPEQAETPARIHVFHGNDVRAMEEAVRALAASCREATGPPVRFESDADPGAVYQELYTPQLLGGGRKLVVLLDLPRRRGPGEKTDAGGGRDGEDEGGGDGEKDAGAGGSWAVHHKKLLQEILDAPPADATFVLVTPRWPIAGVQPAAGGAVVRAFAAPKDYEKARRAPADIAAAFARRRKRIAPDAVRALLDRLGPDAGLLDEAAEVLSLHTGSRDEVTRADVEALVQALRPGDTFRMTRAIVFGEAAPALEELRRLRARAKSDGEFGPKTLGAIAWQFRVVARSLEALADGDRGAALKPWYGVRPEEQPRLVRRLETLRGVRLGRAREWLLETDLALKTGRTPARLALETLVVRLAAL